MSAAPAREDLIGREFACHTEAERVRDRLVPAGTSLPSGSGGFRLESGSEPGLVCFTADSTAPTLTAVPDYTIYQASVDGVSGAVLRTATTFSEATLRAPSTP